jgi:hypothetical protein
MPSGCRERDCRLNLEVRRFLRVFLEDIKAIAQGLGGYLFDGGPDLRIGNGLAQLSLPSLPRPMRMRGYES